MTDKQKAAFLKREGWSYREWSCGHGWADPSRNYTWSLNMAYRRACRNKSQRDTRRLKAAGWEYRVLGDGKGNIYRDWCWSEKRDNGKCLFAKTRAEALKLLEAGNG